MRAELAARTEENRRKDHLIAGLIERVPALEAATSQNVAESANLAPQSDVPRDVPLAVAPEPILRRWWRRVMGG